MATLDASCNQIDIGLKTLRAHWETARVLWNDAVSRSFERHYYESLTSQTRDTLKEMQKLTGVIAEARRQIH